MGRGGRIETDSAEQTIDLGRRLASQVAPGDVVCFFGDLGAGKTTLIKGLVEALTGTPTHAVCSPTFAYLNVYEGACPVYHFDLYRLEDEEAFLSLGFEEYLYGSGVCCIEWSERIEKILPPSTRRITLSYLGPEKRSIVYAEPDSRF